MSFREEGFNGYKKYKKRRYILFSPTTIVAPITSKLNKAKLPTHIEVRAKQFGLEKDSVMLLEQIRTIDKIRLKEFLGTVDDNIVEKVDSVLKISLALN